jgi:AcrR family transcriptional regulator
VGEEHFAVDGEPVGRTSLAPLRQEQLVDATVQCIVANGLAATTLSKIAQVAGVQTSVVSHYFGNKDAVIAAAIERSLANVRALIVDRFEDVPRSKLLSAQLDVLFDIEIAAPEIGPLIHEIIAASFFDPTVRSQLETLYRSFTTILDVSVRASYPKSPAGRRATVVHGLLALAHANAIFEWLAFDPDHFKRGRAAANVLLTSLEPTTKEKSK